MRAEKTRDVDRLDSFLVLAGQENSSLRRQLLAAGITPDVIPVDGRGGASRGGAGGDRSGGGTPGQTYARVAVRAAVA